jgi:Kelch motif
MVVGFIVVAASGGGITAERDGVEASGAVALERVSSATVAASVGPGGIASVTTQLPAVTTLATVTTTSASTTALGGSWRAMAPSPLGPRSAPVSAWTGSELLVWSGIPSTSDACEMGEGGGMCGEPAVFDGAAYSPATDTWRTMAEGPVPAAGAPTQVIPVGVWTGSELVVWGGWGSPIAAAYDPVTDRWRDLPPGPLADRQGQAMVLWDGRVGVLGGQQPFGPDESEPRLDGALLDPSTGEWSPLPDLPADDPMMAPGLISATVADDRLFVVARVTADAYVLDPGATEWRNLGVAEIDGSLDPVGVAAGRWLFATNGWDRPTTSAAVLDLTTGQWTGTADPPVVAAGYLSAGADDRVLAMAGQVAHDTSPPTAMSWDPATDTWAELPPPPLAHRLDAAVAWTGTELLVWGGASESGTGGPSHADGAAFHP